MIYEHYQCIIAAPGFNLGVRCNEESLLAIEFLQPGQELPAENAIAHVVERQLRAYLTAPGSGFDLPLAKLGTDFQRRVWQRIATIPLGQTISYGQLARDIRSAPRAVGQACGANYFPLLIPCHRVVAATGLGGFDRAGGGFLLEVKKWLLRHEGIDRY